MINFRERIISDPGIMLGKPVIKGTRITVELILRKMSSGFDFKEILEGYPQLQIEDIQAAMAYAAAILEAEEMISA